MTDLTKGQVEDYKRYFIEKPSSNFSPEKNKAVIEGTIRKYEAKRAAQQKSYNEKLAERIEASMDFITWQERGGNAGEAPEKYFSRQVLAKLRGQQIVEELQARSGVKIIKPFIA